MWQIYCCLSANRSFLLFFILIFFFPFFFCFSCLLLLVLQCIFSICLKKKSWLLAMFFWYLPLFCGCLVCPCLFFSFLFSLLFWFSGRATIVCVLFCFVLFCFVLFCFILFWLGNLDLLLQQNYYVLD